jgi:hypothetical protein
MTDQQIAFWLITAGIFEIAAVFIAIFVVFPNDEQNLHIVLKAGFALMVMGLVVQIIRSTYYLQHGSYPVDHIFPMWLSKDIGASIMIYYFAFIHGKEKPTR